MPQQSDDILAEFRSGTSQAETISLTRELIRYEEIPEHKRDNNSIHFWEDQSTFFPLLSQIAIIILAVPTSQVGVERHFSIGKILVNARRSKIKPDKLDDTFFVDTNYKLPKIDY